MFLQMGLIFLSGTAYAYVLSTIHTKLNRNATHDVIIKITQICFGKLDLSAKFPFRFVDWAKKNILQFLLKRER